MPIKLVCNRSNIITQAMTEIYTYLFIMLGSIAGPLALSFDKKVAFYKSWPSLRIAIILPAVLYIAWDIYFTKIGVWQFSRYRVLGKYFFGLPLEEVAFFFIVPYCSVFIYACIKAYLPKIENAKWATIFWYLVAALLIIFGCLNFNKYYTSWTFLGCGAALLIALIVPLVKKNFYTLRFLLSYLIILIPFLIVNGLLTSIPVVIYNNAENLSIRIWTIPFEDVFYGMLLILMNVLIYEWLTPADSHAVE